MENDFYFERNEEKCENLTIHKDKELLAMKPSFEFEVTRGERIRFIAACKGDLDLTIKRIDQYLHFRQNEMLRHLNSIKSVGYDDNFLKMVSITESVARNNTRIVYVMPAIFEFSSAKDELTIGSARYEALSVACYFDSQLPRDSMEKLTVLIDVRAGVGKDFSNANAFKFLSFAKHTIHYLQCYFCERLDACIIFPVPSTMIFIWRLFRAFIDSDTRKRFKLISGDSDGLADIPISLEEVVHLDTIKRLETRRWSFFDFSNLKGGLEGEMKRRNKKHRWIEELVHVVRKSATTDSIP